MDLYVLDESFTTLCVFDVYESFIWTDRYYECGDFEAYLSPHEAFMEFMKEDNYIWRKDSDHVMIIKRIEVSTDAKEGSHAIVTGESLESILKDRVIAKQTILSGSLQNGIQTLLNQTIISPSNQDRRISNFVFEASSDPAITGLKLEAQYFGENLYDVVSDVCRSEHIGFKVILSDDGKFVFQLYKGLDRSYDQNERPYIIFSPNYDNLVNSNYVYDTNNIRNVAYIAGEEPESEKESDKKPLITTQIVAMTGSGKGLKRKEIFVNGNNLKTSYRNEETGETVYLSESEYRPQLEEKGKEKLSEYSAEETFDGQIEGEFQWTLGKDYFMGDIIQIENEYKRTAKCRIVEMITSDDTSGQSFYPGFESVDE